MKYLRSLLVLFLFVCSPAFAQWQVPDHSVPIGRGVGATGFNSVPPGAVGNVLTSNGPNADPSYQPLPAPPPTGVTSLGGMTGAIACGTGLTCASGSVSAAPSPVGIIAVSIGATSFPATVKSIVTSGYAADGDKGAGAVYVRGTSGCVGDILSADGAHWCLSLNQWFSVGFFGAKCDGATNDTAQVQAAILAAQAVSGTVFFPGGGYCVTTTDLSIATGYITLVGTGRNSGIKPTFSSPASGFSINAQGPVVMSNFAIAFPSLIANNFAGVNVSAPSGQENIASIFDQMFIVNAQVAINFDKASKFILQNSELNNNTFGINMRNGNNSDSGDSRILNNEIGTSGVSAIRFQSSGGVRIIGNKINVAPTGIEIFLENGANTTGVYMAANSIENISGDGILMHRQTNSGQLQGVTVTGNEIVAQRCINIPNDPNGAWLINVNVIGTYCQGLGSGNNVMAVFNSVNTFLATNLTFTCNGSSNQKIAVGASAANGIVGQSISSCTPSVASSNAGSNVTTVAPF